MGKSGKDKRDIYYRLAKHNGLRARSAYKLIEIDKHFDILSNVEYVVDLCAAPGSWSQVLANKLYYNNCKVLNVNENNVKIIACDLQTMAHIDGVIQLQCDITNESTAKQIISHMYGSNADLVVCDGAPDVTGLHDIDQYIQSQLVTAALYITTSVLKIGGTFVAKIFRGKDVELLYSQLKIFFSEVFVTKPRSSRNSSIEAFVVCRNYLPPNDYKPVLFNDYLNQKCDQYFDSITSEPNRHVIPFIACGDVNGFDSDATYPLNISDTDLDKYSYREPTQSPIDPPYQKAVELKKTSSLAKPSLNQDLN